MARKDANPGDKEKAAARRIDALNMRKAGASYRAIGRKLGVSEAQAFRDVQTCLAELAAEQKQSAEELRQMELERLDAMLLANWSRAMGSEKVPADLKAQDRILRIMERRAKLLGLDAPTKIAPTTPDGKQSVQLMVVYTDGVKPITDDINDTD
jgi:hypothetical protein